MKGALQLTDRSAFTIIKIIGPRRGSRSTDNCADGTIAPRRSFILTRTSGAKELIACEHSSQGEICRPEISTLYFQPHERCVSGDNSSDLMWERSLLELGRHTGSIGWI